MHVAAGVLSGAVILIVLWDAFETIILPRRNEADLAENHQILWDRPVAEGRNQRGGNRQIRRRLADSQAAGRRRLRTAGGIGVGPYNRRVFALADVAGTRTPDPRIS